MTQRRMNTQQSPRYSPGSYKNWILVPATVAVPIFLYSECLAYDSAELTDQLT